MHDAEKAFLQRQLSIDSAFLKGLNIMDYSLLLCIESRSSGDCAETLVRNRTVNASSNGHGFVRNGTCQTDLTCSKESTLSSTSIRQLQEKLISQKHKTRSVGNEEMMN